MFTNECLTGIEYESTTSAIVMAGLFISFIVDYCAHRVISKSSGREDGHVGSYGGDDALQVLTLEVGIIFHSVCKYKKCRRHT